MNLAELPFTGEQRRLVADLEALHSPLEICAFSYSDAPDEQALARRAAVEGMRVFHRRYVERLRRGDPGVPDPVEWLAGGVTRRPAGGRPTCCSAPSTCWGSTPDRYAVSPAGTPS